jgi:hypothetical protein
MFLCFILYMRLSNLIIATFVVTALWDVILRYMSLNFERIPGVIQRRMPFIKDLKPYFQNHTLLAAALIAGFIGATTQPIIIAFMQFPKRNSTLSYLIKFLTISFIVSALYGFLMKWSKLFPHLQKHYYDRLGLVRSLYHDGISGLIVQITLLVGFRLL